MKRLAQYLLPTFFPYDRINQVPLAEVTSCVEKVWQQFGLPKAIRTDNGAPFGVPTRDVIPTLSLWLLGHGVTPILNRPRRPQDNAKVERSQGTTARWAEIDKAKNAQHLQELLNDAIRIQRDVYPNRKIGNAPRSVVFKDLYSIKRHFDKQNFNPNAAYQKLEAMPLLRKVSSAGAIALYGHRFQVHIKFATQNVVLKFNTRTLMFDVFDQTNNLIKSIDDIRFTKQNLANISLFQKN